MVRPPRMSRKGGTSVGIKKGADLAATKQPKKTKSRMHANIDFKGGDSVQVHLGARLQPRRG